MTRKEAQRPRLLTNSADSQTLIKWVAPPGRKEARLNALGRSWFLDGRSSFSSNFWSLDLNVEPEKFQSISKGFNSAKPIRTTSIKSACSNFPAWWRAARYLVLGSLMRRSTKSTLFPMSEGSTKSSRLAARISPMRRSAPQARAKHAASRFQPHDQAPAIKAIRIWKGIAMWCSAGSWEPHIKAKSQLCCRERRTNGRLQVMAFIVSLKW